MSIFRKNGFRMELNTIDRQCFMGNSHNSTIIRKRIHLILLRNAVFPHDQGMVSCHLVFLRQACKHSCSVVVDLCYFSVHGTHTLFHYCSPTVANHLMAQTDTKNRNPSLKSFYGIYAELRIPGTLRSRRKDDSFRVQLFQFLQGDLVAASDQDLSSKLLKICLEIINK